MEKSAVRAHVARGRPRHDDAIWMSRPSKRHASTEVGESPHSAPLSPRCDSGDFGMSAAACVSGGAPHVRLVGAGRLARRSTCRAFAASRQVVGTSSSAPSSPVAGGVAATQWRRRRRRHDAGARRRVVARSPQILHHSDVDDGHRVRAGRGEACPPRIPRDFEYVGRAAAVAARTERLEQRPRVRRPDMKPAAERARREVVACDVRRTRRRDEVTRGERRSEVAARVASWARSKRQPPAASGARACVPRDGWHATP